MIYWNIVEYFKCSFIGVKFGFVFGLFVLDEIESVFFGCIDDISLDVIK